MIEKFAPPDGSATCGTVLLVDDEPSTLRAIGRLLRKRGYAAVCASDAAQAATLLSLRRFDAVVTDLRLVMPSGMGFATHVASLAPGIPLIVFTGVHGLQEVWDLLAGSKVDAVVPKSSGEAGIAAALGRSIAISRELARAGHGVHHIADGLVRALAFRDVETEAHSRRVSAWTLLLAQRLSVPREEWLHAELGGLLHDIGKIGVADAILRKPEKLDADEWAEMRRHPEIGCTILSGIPALADCCDIVRSHHERWDGSGYPDGLSGEGIPPHARTFALVDTYDAITCDRPYRKGRAYPDAFRIIVDESGRQFDPRVVEAFRSVPEMEWLAVARTFHEQASSANAGTALSSYPPS